MLDERKIKAIDLIIEGDLTKSNISKLVGISDRQLYRWMEDEEFTSELHKRTEQVKTLARKEFDGKLNIALGELWKIIHSDVDVRTREKALEYWINRSLGTPTNKTEVTENSNKDNISDKDLKDILDEVELD